MNLQIRNLSIDLLLMEGVSEVTCRYSEGVKIHLHCYEGWAESVYDLLPSVITNTMTVTKQDNVIILS